MTEVRELLRSAASTCCEEEAALAVSSSSPRPGARSVARGRRARLDPGGRRLRARARVWEVAIKALRRSRSSCCRSRATIVRTFWTTARVLWHAGWYTFTEALGGFVIGSRAADRSPRSSSRRFRRLGLGADADRDRGERDPDHRVRADRQRVVRPAREDVEDGDRGGALLLPGARQHAARAADRPAAADRADALLRRRRADDLPPRAHSRRRCRTCSRRSRWRACWR